MLIAGHELTVGGTDGICKGSFSHIKSSSCIIDFMECFSEQICSMVRLCCLCLAENGLYVRKRKCFSVRMEKEREKLYSNFFFNGYCMF